MTSISDGCTICDVAMDHRRKLTGMQTLESGHAACQQSMKGDTAEMITKDMIIGDVISEHPELVRTFFANGMMCIGCPASQGESIEAAAQVHGLDGDALVAALNEALA